MEHHPEYRPFDPNNPDNNCVGLKSAYDFGMTSAMREGDCLYPLLIAPGLADVVIEKNYADYERHGWIWHYTVRMPIEEALGDRPEVLARARQYAAATPS
jgi:hypothetical protein